MGCVGRCFASSEKGDDNVTCSVELSDVVVELLTCERVGSDAMYVGDVCKIVPTGKLVQERG